MLVVVGGDLFVCHRIFFLDRLFKLAVVDGEDADVDPSGLQETRLSFAELIGQCLPEWDAVCLTLEVVLQLVGCEFLVVDKRRDGQHGHVERLFDLLLSQLLPGLVGCHDPAGLQDFDGCQDPDFLPQGIKRLGFGGTDSPECPVVECRTKPVPVRNRIGHCHQVAGLLFILIGSSEE